MLQRYIKKNKKHILKKKIVIFAEKKKKMKIIYTYESLNIPGGADRVITEKANYLAAHGYEVIIIVTSQAGAKPYYPISPKVKFVDLNINFYKQYGHNIMYRAYIYFSLMRVYRKKLSSILFSEHPDIVITPLGREIDFITKIKDGSKKIGESHIAKLYARNLHLMEQHNLIYRFIANIWRRKLDNAVSKLDALVLLTQHDADSWAGNTKTFVIPNSLPFYPERISSCENKQAIFVGRLNEQKGLEYLVKIWEEVHHKHQDWILNIYGDGEQKQLLKELIRESGLERVVVMHQPTTQIMDKYLESSVCVLTSRFEGFGMVLIEAMACGVPVVSFNCPWGPADIIKDGVDGFLVEHLNTKKASEKICQLIEDKNLRKNMGSQARKNIIRYDRDNIMKQWIDLFKSLSSNNRS